MIELWEITDTTTDATIQAAECNCEALMGEAMRTPKEIYNDYFMMLMLEAPTHGDILKLIESVQKETKEGLEAKLNIAVEALEKISEWKVGDNPADKALASIKDNVQVSPTETLSDDMVARIIFELHNEIQFFGEYGQQDNDGVLKAVEAVLKSLQHQVMNESEK